MDSLVRVAQVPRFAETNRHSNADLMAAAIKLDFDTVCDIVSEEFPDAVLGGHETLAEAESYSVENGHSYSHTTNQIIAPLRQNQALIRQISQMITALYLAHG